MQNNTRPTIRYERITEDEPKAQLPKTAMMFSAVLGFLAIATFVALQVAFPGGVASSGGVSSSIQSTGPAQTVATGASSGGGTSMEGSFQFDVDWNANISNLQPISIEGLAVSRISERWGLAPLAAMDRFHPERRVDIAFAVPLEDLLAANDEAARQEVFVAIARNECVAMTEHFADACALVSAKWSTTQQSQPEGWAEARIELIFTQKDQFGSMPTPVGSKAGVYSEKRLPLSSRGKAGLTSRTLNGAPNRRALYADVARKCAAQRRRNNNCAIQSVKVRTSPMAERGSLTEAQVTIGSVLRSAG